MSVLISVIVFNLFSKLQDNILIPLLNVTILNKLKLNDMILEIKNETVSYGNFIKCFLYTLIILTTIYYFL